MHAEHHYSNRLAWLRAMVLGANDGIISMSGLVIGLRASGMAERDQLIAALAALVAGALSMWAGEYIAVSSQADSEQADLEREKQALEESPEEEFEELVLAYRKKGLSESLARQVSEQIYKKDPLAAHLQEELNFQEGHEAKPWLAAFSSLFAFCLGGSVPVLFSNLLYLQIYEIYLVTAGCLVALGFSSAKIGGVNPLRPILRVLGFGILVMLLSERLGSLFQMPLV